MRRLALAFVLLAATRAQSQHPRWIATWSPSYYATTPRPTNPDSADRVPTYVDRSLREIVHTSIGGTRVRVRFTNEYGDRPLVIGAAHIAVRDSGARVRTSTDRALTFGGKPRVILRPGAIVVSDAVSLDVPQLADVAITLYIPDSIRAATSHPLGLQTNYIGVGDQSSAETLDVEKTFTQFLFVAGVDVVNARATGAIVAIGNSITDGTASTSTGTRAGRTDSHSACSHRVNRHGPSSTRGSAAIACCLRPQDRVRSRASTGMSSCSRA